MGTLFGTDGIRGQANVYPITPEIAMQVGKAIAQVFEAGGHGTARAVIGKDTRLSGYMLETALTSGLVSAGMDVFLVGPIPTPAVAHLTRSMGAAVGIMLTASHNPYDDNGIKIFDDQGFKLSDEVESRIEAAVLSGETGGEEIRSADLGKAYRIDDARGRYIEFAKSTVDNQKLNGLKIVLDCANGAAYQIAPWIFKELGAKVIKAFVDPDGYNINENCGAMHPETMGNLVCEHGADLGIAFDGDADRVIFCDAAGNEVDGDRILAMCALNYKKQGLLKKDTLVVTSMSNLGLHDAMRHHGIKVVATDVGDRYVIERMRADGYCIGGEKSGHVILMDYATTGDGIITALQVLKLLKDTGKPLVELADCMTEYPQKLVALPVKEKKPLEELERVTQILNECRTALGDEGRVIVRYSGTEKKIRLLVESQHESDVSYWTGKLIEAVEEEIGV
jgi:phosphoglucosamine mutase